MGTGGLLRLPRFLRSFIQVVAAQQAHRVSAAPSLVSPFARMSDVAVGLIISMLLLGLRILLESTVFSLVFSKFTGRKRARLGENLFYSVYYVLAFKFFLFVLRPAVDWDAPLLTNENVVVSSLLDVYPPPMVWAERFYYSQAMGFYMAGTVFLLVFDSRRSDFVEIMLHHVVTLGLVGMSYAYGYVRTGIIVLALHDVGDIFLYSAKFLHYLGFAGWDTALFVVFMVTFYITRLVLYARIVYAIAVDTLVTVVERPAFCSWAMYFDTYIWHYLFFVLFLGTLLVLHCFWFVLMLKMVYREVVVGKKISDEGDIRSDDEEEEDTKENGELHRNVQNGVRKVIEKVEHY